MLAHKLVPVATAAAISLAIAGPASASDPGALPATQAMAKADPLPPLPMPKHPFQNNDGYAGAHADSYNSAVIPAAGPLSKDTTIHAYRSKQVPAFCSTQHFDSKGRVITLCVGTHNPGKLLLLDPATLDVLAEQQLPPMAGYYFKLDEKGRVVLPAGDLSIRKYEIDESSGAPKWRLVRNFDIGAAVPAAKRVPWSIPLDIVADWQDNWWFVIMQPATVGYVTPAGKVHFVRLEGENIANGIAADPDGVYFVTDTYLYGMRAEASGPKTFMKFAYETGTGDAGPGAGQLGTDDTGELDKGSGTTPTIFGNKLIAFGDTADPRPNAVVYRIDDVPDKDRLVCKVPLFKPGRAVLENSFIGYDHSLVVENNKGMTMGGDSSEGEPGFVRIDVRKDLSGCDTVWENYEVRAGTGAKLSTGNGMIYVHELLKGTADDWYLTAIDFRTGDVAWRKYLGKGLDWDNALLTLSISPNGLLTSGMYGGVVSAKDAK
ncbi:SMP-30/gluconolactonase/LRE family protein [Novosphingobium malaysiense]|uniref:Uncharacterized protein n=1 Tax=Novosphingobium malaysiense TaxID=1348853 RepID=A0A0B1ZM25_9SPHN|nr:hypothetical protein [Novosphingobium malaysiense]KHK90389.1 hypothetical protein LK12_17520 [Novosphingobium malaysiense]